MTEDTQQDFLSGRVDAFRRLSLPLPFDVDDRLRVAIDSELEEAATELLPEFGPAHLGAVFLEDGAHCRTEKAPEHGTQFLQDPAPNRIVTCFGILEELQSKIMGGRHRSIDTSCSEFAVEKVGLEQRFRKP